MCVNKTGESYRLNETLNFSTNNNVEKNNYEPPFFLYLHQIKGGTLFVTKVVKFLMIIYSFNNDWNNNEHPIYHSRQVSRVLRKERLETYYNP